MKVIYAFLPVFCVVFSLEAPVGAQQLDLPDPAAAAQTAVANVKGVFDSPPKNTPTSKMPDGPVAGNGDLGLTVGGPPSQLNFYLGKSDFFGVINGRVMPVGALALNVPELQDSSYHMEQAIGNAVLTGKFTAKSGAELSLKSWVAISQNLLVVELSNTGSEPLTISSKLLDAASTSGNEATYQSSPNSTALRVSPDSWKMELGNFLEHHGDRIIPHGVFQGDLADVRIYEQALPPSALSSLDDPTAPRPYLLWHPSDKTPVSGQARIDPNGDHGGIITLGDDPAAEVPMGYLEIPEQQFTITAWVRATATSDQNIILTTYYDWIGVGMKFYLSKGKLSAALNHTAVTSDEPIPLNQWTQLAATYDGQSLKLFQDGKEIGSTDQFPPTSEVMGSNRSAIHLGDKELPFEGCAPRGVMVQRILGAKTMEDQHALNFTLQPNDQATILVAVSTDRKSPEYLTQARQMAALIDAAALAKLDQERVKWWSDFWSKSFIKISDQRIQDSWYGSLYLLACCSRADCPPPGLWGNFVTDPNMGWQGDYTLDYNYEAPFWAALATNHLELAENYEAPLLDNMPRAAHNGPEHFHHPGLAYYTHLIPVPGWDADPTEYMKQKGCTLFALVDCVMRWRYTHDLDYAKKIYPLLKGAAEFWDNDLVLKDGAYYDADDAAAEQSDGNNNTSTTLAFIRLVYPALLELSQALNLDEDQRDKWNDVLAKLPPYPIVPTESIDRLGDKNGQTLAEVIGPEAQGQKVIRNAETGYAFPSPMYHVYQDRQQRNSSPGMSSAQVIFPGWGIGLESSDDEKQAALNTITYAAQWYDYNNECTFYPGAACVGYDPKVILKNLNGLIDTQMAPNFMFRTGGGGTEDFAIVPATVSAMFIQSYQKNIHVFQDWPMDQDAAFGNLNACGGFLLSSELTQGEVKYVQIKSVAGLECRLVNPWPESRVRLSSDQAVPIILSGNILTFPTRPREVILIRPQ
jgi:alpha-L-fucosidase 2